MIQLTFNRRPHSQWTKHYRYIYHTTGFDPTYCSKTKYCMRQSVAQVTAGCNKQNVVFNNGLLELQPAVMLQFCNFTARYYLNHCLLGHFPSESVSILHLFSSSFSLLTPERSVKTDCLKLENKRTRSHWRREKLDFMCKGRSRSSILRI